MGNSALNISLGIAPISNDSNEPTAFAYYSMKSLGLPDNTALSSITDLSGNGKTLTVNSGSPTYKILGGKGSVYFDGTDDCLTNTNFDLNGIGEISLHFVGAYNANQGASENDGPIFINETASYGKLWLGAMYNSVQWRLGSGLSSNTNSYAYSPPGNGIFTTLSLIRTVVSGTVYERLWVNGSLVDTKNLGTTNTLLANNATTLFLGKGGAIFTNYYIRGFAVYLGNTEAIRADIEAALS